MALSFCSDMGPGILTVTAVLRSMKSGRLAREAQDRQRAPRGQGGQPLALRLNDLLGHTAGPGAGFTLVVQACARASLWHARRSTKGSRVRGRSLDARS